MWLRTRLFSEPYVRSSPPRLQITGQTKYFVVFPRFAHLFLRIFLYVFHFSVLSTLSFGTLDCSDARKFGA